MGLPFGLYPLEPQCISEVVSGILNLTFVTSSWHIISGLSIRCCVLVAVLFELESWKNCPTIHPTNCPLARVIGTPNSHIWDRDLALITGLGSRTAFRSASPWGRLHWTPLLYRHWWLQSSITCSISNSIGSDISKLRPPLLTFQTVHSLSDGTRGFEFCLLLIWSWVRRTSLNSLFLKAQ